jgi:hypothetical protein
MLSPGAVLRQARMAGGLACRSIPRSEEEFPMRSFKRAGLVLFLAALAAQPAAAEDPAPWVMDSRAAAQALGSRLMGELTAALAKSPAAAIDVCSERAPRIAAEEAAARGAEIGRTALRFRNPDNAPEAWQRRGLESFATALAAGADPATLEFTEVAGTDGTVERRWMKPIMTGPLCLTCHGETLAPEVAAAVQARYPDDRATGFAAGDLRGAFYVVWREPAGR